MSPISQERLNWIEARLFVLARTTHVMRREGLRHATRYFTDSHQEAHAIFMKTVQDLNSERLLLMMERTAITEYMNEEMRGMPSAN